LEIQNILDRMEAIQLKMNELTMRLSYAERDLAEAHAENESLKKRLKQANAPTTNTDINQQYLPKHLEKSEIFHKLVLNYSQDELQKEQLSVLIEEYIKDIDNCISTLSN
jgi:chromosome segregation ATPase